MLEVPEALASAEDCKQLSREFIERSNILPAEWQSLYRYVRSVARRAQLEREAALIVEDINAEHFDRLGAESSGDGGAQERAALADARLAALSEAIPHRLGEQGTGTAIVTTILRRNVAKMRLVNELAAKLHEA